MSNIINLPDLYVMTLYYGEFLKKPYNTSLKPDLRDLMKMVEVGSPHHKPPTPIFIYESNITRL